MSIDRRAAKRQIASARALISWLQRSGVADTESQQLLIRLEATTEALARQAYTPASSSPPQPR